MCGIFGMSLKAGANKRAALQKFKILGLYNIKRGRDASGVFVNGEIIKGIGMISEFDDFLEDKFIPAPKDNAIMIGHTRQGSYGYNKTINEAHPFLINEDLVFTHNGTIKNVKALCEKYRKIESDFTVDSQVLGTILDEDGTDVLEDYVGAAALAYTYQSEPNILYLYHGQSKDYKHGNLLEERPLFYMETKDGVYYSSLEESLKAIREDEKEVPLMLNHNHIFKIENGKFLLDQSIKINREEANVTVYTQSSHQGKQSKTSMKNTGGISIINNHFTSGGVSSKDFKLVKREALPIRLLEAKERKGFIYYHQGRYWEAPRTLLNGPAYIRKNAEFGTMDDGHSELLFFWSGILLKGKQAYQEVDRLSKELTGRNFVRHPNEHNFALRMSNYSQYPITNIGVEGWTLGDYYRHIWYKNGQDCAKDNYTAKFSNGRNYKIEKGCLLKISPSQHERAIWETEDIAAAEEKALIDGTLLVRTPGGSSQQPLFLLPERIQGSELVSESPKRDDDELVWFFDVPFTTMEKGLENIGEDEMEALREYTSLTYTSKMNLRPLAMEVEAQLEEVFNEATRAKCTLMDMITDDEDKQLLVKCYEDIIDKKLKQSEKEIDDDLPFSEAIENTMVGKTAAYLSREEFLNNTYYQEEEDDDMTRAELVDLVETSINELEDMQATSIDLMADEDNVLAQECASTIMQGATTTLANLESVLLKHKEHDLANRVKKVRETKSMKDGVL